MLNKFLDTINQYKMLDMKKKNLVVIGVSGGADSICLLDLFLKIKKKFDLKIIVAHLNHDLRGKESDRDENFVKNICAKQYQNKKIIFEYRKICVKNFAKEKKINLEEAGRLCRYNFFRDLCKQYDADKIATAHNKNDNVETVLMKLIRGCGSDGFSGIRPIQNKIIRPLINISRDEIEIYCKKNNLDFVTDSSNLDSFYTRNKIRNKIMPVLKEINPNFLDTIVRSIKIIDTENNYLRQKAEKIINGFVCDKKNFFLDLDKINCLPNILQNKIVYLMIKKILGDGFCYKNINSVLELIKKNNGKKVFIGKNIVAEKSFNKIIFYDLGKKIKNITAFEYKIKLNEIIFISQIKNYILISEKKFFDIKNIFSEKIVLFTKEFYCDNVEKLIIRNYRTGDRIFFDGFGHKELKKIFSEKKILSRERRNIPVLAIDNNVVWIMDKNIDIISNGVGLLKKKYFIYILGDIER